MEFECVQREKLERRALHPGRRTDEALRDDLLMKSQRLEELRALVRRQGGHTHLGKHFKDTLVGRLHVIGDELLSTLSILRPIFTSAKAIFNQVHSQSLLGNLVDHLHDEPRADGIRSVPNKNTHVVDLSGFAGLDHDSHIRTLLLLNQEMMDPTTSEDS